MGRTCTFNTAWLANKEYKAWLMRDAGNLDTMAMCRYCLKSFDISNMGEAALRSHMKRKKHTDLVPALSDKESQSELVTVPAPASTVTSEAEIYSNT